MKKIVCISTVLAFLSADEYMLNGGFLQSARFEPKRPAGLNISGYFNEYAASQDSMEVGYKGNTDDGFYPTYHVPDGSVIRFGNNYKPGFEVGLMFDLPYDKWEMGIEYLWYRGHYSLENSATASQYFYSPVFSGIYGLPLSSVKADWWLSLDLVDLFLVRPYYSGRRLTVEPALGLKLGSIRQKFDMSANVLRGRWVSQTADTHSRSFGVGPRLGCQSNYLLGKGFNIFGDLFTTLFYTRYTTNEVNYENALGATSHLSENNYGTVRPIFDGGMGIGWKGYFGFGSGAYYWHKSFYMSLSLAYNFSLFFSQNVSRGLIAVGSGIQQTPGNLYLQGLSLGLDFIF